MVTNLKYQDIDCSVLDKEPIQFNGIQPHGVLLVLEEKELKILQVSNNTYSVLGIPPEYLVQKRLEDLLDPSQVERIKTGFLEDTLDFINPTKIWIKKAKDEHVVFDGIFHRNADGFLILELEPAISQQSIPFLSFYHLAKASIKQLEETSNLKNYYQTIVKEVRNVTNFDRVMLYKFDDDGHGAVIAEDKIESLEPYLGLHFPETDIPQQARKLFCTNWIRIIPDSHCQPVKLFPIHNPVSQRPLDLTLSILRSAASCHVEYLHNMGVGASMTISLVKDQKLWGLIACHHQSPKHVSYELRKACEFLGKMIFSEILSREENEDDDYQMKLTYIQSKLIKYMSQERNFIDGLLKHQSYLLELTNAQGAAVCFRGRCTLAGDTPPVENVNFLIQWLEDNVGQEVFYTDSLSYVYPDAEKFKNCASGLLAIPISQKNYVLWFRPEVIQTVNWGGNPNQAFTVSKTDGSVRLSPRKSFELWKETVSLTSLPWKQVEINAALQLKEAIINIVLRQAEELSQLAADLERSNAELKKFASHDLQEPLNQVANYVQLLGMDYEDKLDEDAKKLINSTAEQVSLMQKLIRTVGG